MIYDSVFERQAKTEALLGRLGCRHIRVFPLGTLKAEIPQETVILAHV